MDTEIIATSVERDEGSIVLMRGVDRDERGRFRSRLFAVDHRMAQPIIEAMRAGERPRCIVPDWAVMG